MNITCSVLAVMVVLVPALAQSQADESPRPAQGLSIIGGAFQDERGAGGLRPYASIRYERWLSRFVAFEGGITHARADRQTLSPEPSTVATPYSSGDLGLQLQGPWRFIRPYLGATIGGTFFHGGDYLGSDAGITHGVLTGARIGAFRDVSFRAELRLRRDDIGKAIAYNAEYGFGLTYRY